MADPPIRLEELHVALLMRIFVLGGKDIPLARLIRELEGRRSVAEISSAVTDLTSAELATVSLSGEERLITLAASGRRNARMWLDVATLTAGDLNHPTVPISRFLDFFSQASDGTPSRWQLLMLQWKWLFRRNWGPA